MVFPALIRKLSVFTLSIFCLSLVFTSPIFAQNTTTSYGSSDAYNPATASTNANVPDNMHTRAQVILIELMAAGLCQLTGIDYIDPTRGCIGVDTATGKLGYANTEQPQVGGAIGLISGMIGMTYNLPIHTDDYTGYLASNFGLAKTAHAQGVGFDSLEPMLSLWVKVRDMAYLGLVILFVLIGLGIMLRVKVDPRTVMAVQNQIPKVIISILLITFSYAIAGLLIDVMWFATYLGINLIGSEAVCTETVGGNLVSTATYNLLSNPIRYVSALMSECGGGFGFSELSGGVGQTVGDMIVSTVSGLFVVPTASTCSFSPETWVDCMGDAFGNFFSFLIGIAASFIISLAIFTQLFRVWFELIKSYIYILMYTILGPAWIWMGLIPLTKKFGFENWLRHIASGIAMFPVATWLFTLAGVLANHPEMNANPDVNSVFLPPLIANPSLSGNMGMISALGVILIAPEITNMMRQAFNADQSKYVPQIFGGLTAGMASAGSIAGNPSKFLFGKQKNGAFGPLTYYGLKGLGYFSGGTAQDPLRGLGKMKAAWDAQEWRDKSVNTPNFTYSLMDQFTKAQGNKGGGGGGDEGEKKA